MDTFLKNRPFIENEFEEAVWDESTGRSVEQLIDDLSAMQAACGDRPRPTESAEMYAYLLDHMQLQINEHTPFAVKFNIGVDYTRTASLDIFQRFVFNPHRETMLKRYFPQEHRKMHEAAACGMGWSLTDFWHTVPNWDSILKHGFYGILQNAIGAKAALLKSGKYEDAQIVFLDAVITCFEAILRCLKRVYSYSLAFDVPQFSACILALTQRAPASLYEVLQTAVLYLYFEEIGPERGRSLGPIDRLYYPYYRRALENGTTETEIRAMFSYFFLHFTAAKRGAEQPMLIGGGDKNGKDYCNDLTRLILDVYDELCIFNPKIHLRYHADMDDRVYEKALDMIRHGNNSICLINDDAVFQGYRRLGIPSEDAQHYVPLGCYEPIIMGMEEAEIGTAWINMAKGLEFALNNGCDMLTDKPLGVPVEREIHTFEDFLAEYWRQMDDRMEFVIRFVEAQGRHSTEIGPSPIYSATFPVCLEQGRDVHEYPLKYNNMSVKCFGLATVVDSLMAVKKFVFEEKLLTLEELATALKRNWAGYEEIRRRIVNDGEKYGNHLPRPDELMQRITTRLADTYVGRPLERGGVFRIGLDSVDDCFSRGACTAATPDGRMAGAPLSKNLCATVGMDRGGITAYMQSVLKIRSEDFVNSCVMDFVMHPSAVQGEKGLKDFKSLLRVFFAQGGFAAQGNIVNADTLRKAKAHPENYQTLQVRLCGWNEYFVQLSDVAQEAFIKQCEGETL